MAIKSEHGKILRAFEGTVLVKEGSTGNWAYEIVSGKVEVSTLHKRRKMVLARLGPKQWFGELGLVSDAPRTASVVAASDCTLRVITRKTFDRLLRRNPKALYPLLKSLFERLREMNARYLMAIEYQLLSSERRNAPDTQ